MGGETRSIRALRKAGKPIDGTIALRAWNGKGLVEKNKLSGKSDPYLIFTLIQGEKKIVLRQTEAKENTVNPEWDYLEKKEVEVNSSFPEKSQILIECFDWEKIGHHHHMGQVVIDCDALNHDPSESGFTQTEYQLQPHKPDSKVSGKITLTVSYRNTQCWNEDETVRAEAKKQRAQRDQEEREKYNAKVRETVAQKAIEKQKKEEEDTKKEAEREVFIKEMQAKSREEEATRMRNGEDKVYKVNGEQWFHNAKERHLWQRENDYEAYVKECRKDGVKPEAPIEKPDYERDKDYKPNGHLEKPFIMRYETDILMKQNANGPEGNPFDTDNPNSPYYRFPFPS